MNNSNKALIGFFVAAAILAAGWFFISSSPQNSKGITDSQNLNLEDNNNEVIAKVNDKEIASQELERLKQTLGQRGRQISDKQALKQVVNKKLLSEKAQEEGYSVTTEEAESMLKSQLQQQNKSLDDYKQQLKSQGVSYDEQLPKLKKELAIQNYLDNELKSKDSKVTEEEIKSFYDKQKQQSPNNKMPPYEDVKPQIKKTLQQQKQQQAIGPLVQKLREEANIEYLKEFQNEKKSGSQNTPLEINQ